MPGHKHIVAVLILVAAVAMSLIWFSMPPPAEQDGYHVVEERPSYIISKEGQETTCQEASSGLITLSSSNSSQVIQRALETLHGGGKVLVRSGEYVLSSQVELPSNSQVIGEGPGTIFHGQTYISFLIQGRTNVTLGNFTLLGSGGIIVSGVNAPSHDILIRDITATVGSLPEGVFYTLAVQTKVTNISFVRCTALDCGTYGFLNSGKLDGGWIEGISYFQCKAIGCGVEDRPNDWVVGFDLAENVNVRNMLVEDCESSSNWQSGFHFEELETVTNAVLRNCVANNNGIAQGAPDGKGTGWGYVFYMDEPRHDIHLIGCSASGNWHGETNMGPLVLVQS